MLELRDLHTYYGDSHILQGVSLRVGQGECVAIMGRNGAGKTTTLRSLLGLTRARSGQVLLRGADVTRSSTWRIVREGVSYVPEDRGIFASVTVHEHLGIAYRAASGRPGRLPIERIYEIFPRLAARRDSLGGQLSGGEQQMLAVGRAMAAAPDLLVLDEPSEGLAPVIVEALEEVLGRIRRDGTSILLVEQNYHLATRLADRVYVLSQGQVQFSGTVPELQASADVLNEFLSV